MTRILAIDPGPLESAYVLYEHEPDPMTRRNVLPRPILDKAKVGNEAVLGVIQRAASIVEHLCIEKIASFGMAVGEDVFETVYWTGRFAELFLSRGGKVTRIPRHHIKMHLCRSMRAKDPNIRQALIDRFGQPGTIKHPGKTYGVSGDIWSALAVAVTFAEAGYTERPMKPHKSAQPKLKIDHGAGVFDTDLDQPCSPPRLRSRRDEGQT